MNPTPWWRRPFRAMLVVVLALAGIAFAGFKLASNTGFDREIKQIRAKGLPTNPKELDAWYAAVPADENAALKFLEAGNVSVDAAKGKDPGEVDWSTIRIEQRLDSETIGLLEGHLQHNAEALRLMHQAAQMPESRYPIDLSKAPDVRLTHMMQTRRLAQLARWEAVLSAERGDKAAAAEALASGFAVAHTLAQEPLIISELVRIACVSIQVYGMERIVNWADFNEAQLTQIVWKIREASNDCRRSLYRALVGDRAFANTGRKLTFDEYEQLTSMGGFVTNMSEIPAELRKLAYYAKRAAGVHDRDRAFFMRSCGRMIDAAALDFPDLFTRSEAVVQDIARELREHPVVYEISSLELPPMFRIASREAILTARLRCVEMALQIECWRRQNNQRVPHAEELTLIFKEHPRDPLDGAPLQYLPREQSGYQIVATAATAEQKKGTVNPKIQDIAFTVQK